MARWDRCRGTLCVRARERHLHPFRFSHPRPGGGSHSITGRGPLSPVYRAHHRALDHSQSAGDAAGRTNLLGRRIALRSGYQPPQATRPRGEVRRRFHLECPYADDSDSTVLRSGPRRVLRSHGFGATSFAMILILALTIGGLSALGAYAVRWLYAWLTSGSAAWIVPLIMGGAVHVGPTRTTTLPTLRPVSTRRCASTISCRG